MGIEDILGVRRTVDSSSRCDGGCAGSAHREDFHVVASRLGVAGVVVVAVFVVDDVDSCGD